MAGSAGGYADEGDDALITDINVTPLVDVVLVLLIVFMITMPTIVRMDTLKEREMSVVLPQASEAAPLSARPKELYVNVDAEGHYKVRGDAQTEAELAKILAQAQADNPGRASVKIRADRRCRWQCVVTVMNLCNKAKIRDYQVMTAD
jgi:biopolymer transport protein ExbD